MWNSFGVLIMLQTSAVNTSQSSQLPTATGWYVGTSTIFSASWTQYHNPQFK